MAYKVFSNGDALTGSELNTYLMNQSVMVFASTTARDAALTAPTEGMVVWLQDSDKYVYYTGSAWADLISAAGSGNAIINGAFDIWQRGTSFTTTGGVYTADRWKANIVTGDTVSQQTFTPGTAPVTGYEGQFYCRLAAGATSGTRYFFQPIEDVRTFAGQTVTLSFWAKVSTGTTTLTTYFYQGFGSGGSADNPTTDTNFTLTTSWQRFSYSTTMPSVSGKTIGAGSSVQTAFKFTTTSANIDIWGVQLEAGSTATAFKRNATSIQGELAACQRYYLRYTSTNQPYSRFGTGFAEGSNGASFTVPLKQTMRTDPTSIDTSASLVIYDGNTFVTGGTWTIGGSSNKDSITIAYSKTASTTQYRPYFIIANNSTAEFLGFNAEL